MGRRTVGKKLQNPLLSNNLPGSITIEGYTGVGMDVVGAGCEDRRKYQWWTLGEQPYDNVWHTSHTH